MIQIVINYDQGSSNYKVYEPTTQNLILTQDLTEALVTLSLFLQSNGMIAGDILSAEDITYYLDSHTMKAIIESNVKLMKRLRTAPSAFQSSSQKFGGSSSSGGKKGNFKNSNKWGVDSAKKFSSKKSSTFQGATGFKNANKKFGNKS